MPDVVDGAAPRPTPVPPTSVDAAPAPDELAIIAYFGRDPADSPTLRPWDRLEPKLEIQNKTWLTWSVAAGKEVPIFLNFIGDGIPRSSCAAIFLLDPALGLDVKPGETKTVAVRCAGVFPGPRGLPPGSYTTNVTAARPELPIRGIASAFVVRAPPPLDLPARAPRSVNVGDGSFTITDGFLFERGEGGGDIGGERRTLSAGVRLELRAGPPLTIATIELLARPVNRAPSRGNPRPRPAGRRSADPASVCSARGAGSTEAWTAAGRAARIEMSIDAPGGGTWDGRVAANTKADLKLRVATADTLRSGSHTFLVRIIDHRGNASWMESCALTFTSRYESLPSSP